LPCPSVFGPFKRHVPYQHPKKANGEAPQTVVQILKVIHSLVENMNTHIHLSHPARRWIVRLRLGVVFSSSWLIESRRFFSSAAAAAISSWRV
jgi:hypothetical protein